MKECACRCASQTPQQQQQQQCPPPPSVEQQQPSASHGFLRSLRSRRPKRPAWALVLASATVCWLMLLQSSSSLLASTTTHNDVGDNNHPSTRYSGFPPPPSGPPPEAAAWRGLSDKQIKSLSRLGRLLFLNDTKNLRPQNKTFTILVWRHGKSLERRHIFQYGTERHDPFEKCSVSNCKLTYEDQDLNRADAVIFHLHRTENPQTLPKRTPNNRKQRWIFLTDESPHNTFLYRNAKNNMSNYPDVFNWSMSYRMDSDVPVPYGRTVPLTPQEAADALQNVPRNYARGKTGFVAIMGSNCGGVNHRWDYVRQLQRHVPIDVYGACGPLKCPGHVTRDCPLLQKYKFYLAFENSNCRDYLSEKLWWNAYNKDAVPVIMGPSKENCNRLIPARSYLHTADFASPADLGRFLLHLNKSDRDYNYYFQWKYQYKILNEHGYFQSTSRHYCRVCEALNYNDPSSKEYKHPETFLNVQKDCAYGT